MAFRFVDWWYQKGESRGITPGSNEYGKSKPLRALCISLSRYRLNRLLWPIGAARRVLTWYPGLTTTWVAAWPPSMLLPALPLGSRHSTPVRWSWRPHSRRRRRPRSLRLIFRFHVVLRCFSRPARSSALSHSFPMNVTRGCLWGW